MLYAYNVYTGRYWNGHWFCAKRKDAVALDMRFERQLMNADIRQLTNLTVVRPNAKLPKKR